MAHDDVNDLKRRVSNQSVQIMRLEEKVRSLTRERDHWIAEAAEAKAVIIRAFAEAATDHVREICGEKVERPVACEQHFEPYAYPQSWWQRIIGRLFA